MFPGQFLQADVMLPPAENQIHESHTSMYGSLVFCCPVQARAIPCNLIAC